jgi:hypothetical protein
MASSSDDVDPTAKYWVHRWEYHPMPLDIAIITSVFSALLGVLGVFANGLVMFLIVQIKRFHQLENLDILVVSLCFSDFLSSVIVQPVLIPRMLARSRVSPLHSHLIHVSTHFTLVFGSLSLLFITFNRYLSIKFPFYYANHITEMKMYGCLVAISSAAVGMVFWVFFDGQSESATFPIIISIIFFFTIILQIMISMIIHAQNRNMRRQIMAVQHNQSDNISAHMTRQSNIQRAKTNRTILYICAVFIATWLPSIIFRVYYIFHGNLTFYIQWLHIFNIVIQIHSCINPWLYALRTSRVKQILLRIYRRE